AVATFLLVFPRATSPTAVYTLSLHDALPIFLISALADAKPSDRGDRRFVALERPQRVQSARARGDRLHCQAGRKCVAKAMKSIRSEEHTSELQSRENLVCRLLLEKKKESKGT